MIRNVGTWDRTLRVLVGLLLIALTLMGTIGAWGWIGVVPLATGLVGRCAIYGMLGMSTCPLERKKA